MKGIYKSILNCGVIMISLLLYTHFFSFILWEQTIGPKLIWLFLIACIIPAGLFFLKHKNKDINKNILVGLLVFPIIAGLLKNLFSPQPLITERTSILMFFAIMQYYLMNGMKVTEDQIIIVFTIFGLITLALQLYQQIPGNIPAFGIIGNDEENIGRHQRNDIYRFYIGSMFIGMLCLYYWWSAMIKRFSFLRAFLFICFAASIYLYLTKQIMAACLVTLMISVFQVKNKKMRKAASLLIIVSVVLLVVYYDVLFKEMVDEYTGDKESTDTRWVEFRFTIDQILANPIRGLFGHGRDIIEQTWWSKNIYFNDIGFVGECFYYGIVWAFLYFVTCKKYIVKYRNKIPLYLWLFFFGTFIDSLFIFPYRNNYEIFIWVCLLYIGHLHIDNKEGKYKTLIINQ